MNIKEKIRYQPVFSINDVMSTFTYKKSLYYQSFMKEYGFYDELGIYLVHQGKLLGAIGLVRYEHEAPFNAKDTFKLETLTKFLSFSLANCLLLEEIETQKKTLEMLSNASATGQILFNSAMTIYHANSAATEICSVHFTSQVIRNPVQQFLQEVLWNENWKIGLISKIILPTRQEVTIHIMKADISKDHYVAYLYLNNEKEVYRLMEEKLTTKEQDILAYITKGYTNEEVSKELYISVNTVKRHLQNIYRKLGVKNRTSLSYLVMRD
ncbi:LuxR C-terminal-related transcriptional regulator [Bacillus xiapuensis]|uniref:LuxR C-terminal-related transcriptional regulator n=1 Tax=Bacillus xiapuensis TaxID=2014075 RepID=A0ABU6ND40_9BACI|nr:LuxR C-terminal-related transcriptional regulator [Bacillus xiapuensis]